MQKQKKFCQIKYRKILFQKQKKKLQKMKKQKNLIQSPFAETNHKVAQSILKKKPKKEFQLLYRERDQSIQQNPIESIIFVKSKLCKSPQNNKKIKVQQEFKKIMNDLTAHINQHKKQKSSKTLAKNSNFSSVLQMKGTNSSKKSAKQTELTHKKFKQTQRQQSKLLKMVNKGAQQIPKQRVQNLEICKSPKKNEKSFRSPKSKNILSPKALKIEKQNAQTKKFSVQKLSQRKSPKQTTNRKQYNKQTSQISEQNLKKTILKNNFISSPNTQKQSSYSNLRGQNQIKRNLKKIPLKIEQYILIEDNFQLVKQKNLFKLQTKLLSTYRNNCKQYETRISIKQNQIKKDDIFFEKIRKDANQRLNHINFIQRSILSEDDHQQHNITEQNSNQNFSEDQKFQLEKSEVKLGTVEDFFNRKITTIQKWWRAILLKKFEKQNQGRQDCERDKNWSNKQRQQLKQGFEKIQNQLIPIQFPSAQSIEFKRFQEHEAQIQSQSQVQNEDVRMLEIQKHIIKQKKLTHEKILKSLFEQQKITLEDYEKKTFQVIKQYEHELKDIMCLYELIQNSKSSQLLSQKSNTSQKIVPHKIIQASNIICQAPNKISQDEKIIEKVSRPSMEENDEIPMKIYKIGDKISQQMQQFIQSNRNKESREKVQRTSTQFCSQSSPLEQKYKKRTNQQGQQYFEDFQSESSNQNSPHKILHADNFQQFEQNLHEVNHNSFQPNAHFIQMLQKFKEQEEAKTHIDRRIAIQMGALKTEQTQKLVVDTSILGIHQFLVNLFKFYLYYYKDEFLRFINMPYGYQPEKRLQFMQGYQDTSDDLTEDSDGIIYGLEYVISDDVFDQFVQQYYSSSYQGADEQQKMLIQNSKIHDRAIFECFNQALNNFRPYYSINGPPYLWNCSQKALTFYFIAQENIQEVFQKTQFKVLKWASALVGLIIDKYENVSKEEKLKNQNEYSLQEITQHYQTKSHPSILQNRQERQIKQEKNELIDSSNEWFNLQQQKTSTFYEVSSLILQQLVKQFIQEASIY